MIGSLVRWFRRATATKRSRRGAGSAPRFTPRLEVLEGRALPAVFFAGGAVGSVTAPAAPLDANAGGGHHVTPLGGQLGEGSGGSPGRVIQPGLDPGIYSTFGSQVESEPPGSGG